jgi:hypothetical protein
MHTHLAVIEVNCGVLVVVVTVMMEKETRCLRVPSLTSDNLLLRQRQ